MSDEAKNGTVSIGIQVDGKLRGTVDISPTASEDEARAVTLAVPNVAKRLEGRTIEKFIYKPGRIIGIVTVDAEIDAGLQELVDNGEMEVTVENGKNMCRLTEKGLASAAALIKSMRTNPGRSDA